MRHSLDIKGLKAIYISLDSFKSSSGDNISSLLKEKGYPICKAEYI